MRMIINLFDWATNNNDVLIGEWDETNEIPMDKISFSNGKKMKWVCSKCGYNFEQRVSDRVRGHGCPKCARQSHSSIPETICYLAIKQYYPDAIHNYKVEWLKRRELDIFIPSLSVGVEYDGNSWHNESRKQMDADKENLCCEHGITIYRIREIGCEVMDDESRVVYYKPNRQYVDLKDAVVKILATLGVGDALFDDWQQFINISKQEFAKIERSKSIGVMNQEFSSRWDYEKNYPLTPYDILAHSCHKVWLRCERGHSYQRSPNCSSQKGCPICLNKVVLEGFNDLATVYPNLALDWDYEKNDGLKPTEIVFGSNKRVWWKCHVCGYEFQASPNGRRRNKGCCVKCYNDVRGDKYSLAKAQNNSLAEYYPEIAAEWDYSRNQRDPRNVSKMSGIEVWWICPRGHSWSATVHRRTHDRKKCPYCKQLEQ